MTAKRPESSRNSGRKRKRLLPMTCNDIFPHACGRSPMPPADVSSSAAFRPARTMILHPKKSNYKRESLARIKCKAFPFHRLSVSRSECLFLIRTKRRCGRHSRGRPPGPRSSCRSGGSGGKSGRGKEGLPPPRSPACRGNIIGKGAGVPGGKPGDTARRKKPERLTTLRQPKNN